MNETFLSARSAVVALLDMVTKTGTVITDYEKLADKAVLTLLSTKATSITLSDNALTVEDGICKAEIDVSELKTPVLQVRTNSETVNVAVNLGYYNETVQVESVQNMLSASDNSTATLEGDAYRYTFAAVEDATETRYVDLDLSGYNINHLYGELWVTMYNYGTENLTVNLYASHSDNTKFKEFTSRYGIHGDSLTSIDLKPGENLVKIPTFILLWNMQKQRIHGRYDTLLALRFATTTNEEIGIGFGQITIER